MTIREMVFLYLGASVLMFTLVAGNGYCQGSHPDNRTKSPGYAYSFHLRAALFWFPCRSSERIRVV